MNMSDSSSGSESDGVNWGNLVLIVIKTKRERDAKMTTHAQKILSNSSSYKPSFVGS